MSGVPKEQDLCAVHAGPILDNCDRYAREREKVSRLPGISPVSLPSW